VPLLVTVPGIGWVLAYTIAAEIGDISRFATPTKLTGHTGLCPRVYQSGQSDRRGALAKNGPRYLRWADRSNHARQPPPAPYHGGSEAVSAYTSGHARSRLSCKGRFIVCLQCPLVPLVLSLMYPSRTRTVLSVLRTDDGMRRWLQP
jgi:hypothetical protein